MVKSRAACFEHAGKVSLKDINLEPADNQVLVKIDQASICGTDKLYFSGEIPNEVKLPILPWGHEGGGTVVEVGSKVGELSPGDKVMSFGPGTFADYCLYDTPYFCLPAPKGVENTLSCLGEPLACAIYASQLVSRNTQVGDMVAVVGAGFAGQVISQGVKKGGADKVIVVDFVGEKLELAKRLGADIVINAKEEDPLKAIMDITHGRGADVVVEASGSGNGLNTASAIVRHNGTIAIYSHYMKPFMVNMFRWHEDCLNIVHTCLIHRTREEIVVGVREAFRLVSKGLFDVMPLVNRRYRLSEIEEAFQKEKDDRGAVKTLIIP